MTPDEQQELLHKQERFAALPPTEQDRLRELEATVDKEPDARQLHEILIRYHEWLKTLTPNQRADLADLPPEERVRKVKQLKHTQETMRQQALRAELLTSDDLREILDWTKQILWAHRDELLRDMPDTVRKKMANVDEQKQRQMLLYNNLSRARSRTGPRGGLTAMIKPKDVNSLAAKLSPDAKQELTQASTLALQREIIRGWTWQAFHRLASRGARGFAPGMEDDLMHFFQNDLQPSQRQHLLNLPNEMSREELRRMYFEHQRGGARPSDGPDRPWRDGKAGDRDFRGDNFKGGFGGKGGRFSRPHDMPRTEPNETDAPKTDAPPGDPPASDAETKSL